MLASAFLAASVGHRLMRRIGSPYRRALALAILALVISPAALAVDVRLCTSQGIIELELDERNAPRHARNFARYAENGFYSGTILHRAVADTMVQGGGYDTTLARRRPGEPVASEAANGLSNRRGTIAASRSTDPDSATAQFYINLRDNAHLDASADSPGYTVFGRVTAGLDLLDAISRQPTRQMGELPEVPVPLVELESVTVLERDSLFGVSVEPSPASLQAEFQAAMARGDAAATLAAIDALRRGCVTLDSQQHLAEAESALELGRVDRARFGLAQFLARATTLDPLLPRAQRLFAGLPEPVGSDIDRQLVQCRRPEAPSIPDGRFSELVTLQTIEDQVRRYRQLGQSYLLCVSRLIDGGSLNELEAIDATERYNEAVIELTATVTRFNTAVAAYREAQGLTDR
jgi:peptidyl-prolyl cis-trans isomerase A (cyclophilin A)